MIWRMVWSGIREANVIVPITAGTRWETIKAQTPIFSEAARDFNRRSRP